MHVKPLPRPIAIGQAALPMQLCYIVPTDGPAALLNAVFEDCYSRWGGRDALIIPCRDGVIDERFWRWAKALDPDVIYSYVPLEDALLDRLDRDLMPSAVEPHRREADWRPLFREAPEPLNALSLLPYLRNMPRWGIPRSLALVTAYAQTRTFDPFIADSFGIAPFGPGWAYSDEVRRYAQALALGQLGAVYMGSPADEDVPDRIALLSLLTSSKYEAFTMAQLAAMGYDEHRHRLEPAWDTYNVVVGDTNTDRIAFWNARVGLAPHLRRHITALRIPEAALADDAFVASVIDFVARTNYRRNQNGPAIAVIRSASVSPDRLRIFVDPLARRNVHAGIETFASSADGAAVADSPWPPAPSTETERYTESPTVLRPLRPPHLSLWPMPRPPLTGGAWAVRAALARDETDYGVRDGVVRLPRRWQAVYGTLSRALAKATRDGALRFLATNETSAVPVTLIAVERIFVRDLFLNYCFRTRTEPRVVLAAAQPRIRVAISSAGRQLLGFVAKIGDLHDAFAIIDDPFWEAVFAELAGPLGGASDQEIVDIAQQLKARLRDQTEFNTDADLQRLAAEIVRISPRIKSPRPCRPFSWFVERYRERGGDATRLLQLPDGQAQLTARVSEELTVLCNEAVFYQEYTWKCEVCDHRNYVTVDRLTARLPCEVCSQQHALAAHFEHQFLLDEAVARGMREQGLRSVTWALGILQASAHHAFFFSPPLDLIVNGKQLTDLDITCVVDGRLVIGEAKDSRRGFTSTTSNKLIDAARIVRPDAIVLACPDPGAVATLNTQVRYIKETLDDPRIEVRAISSEIRYPGAPTSILARYFWRDEDVNVVRALPAPPPEVRPPAPPEPPAAEPPPLAP